MKSFGERNPLTVAVVGLLAVAIVFLGTFYSQDLPIIGSGATYSADFSEAAGLQAGNEVRVAGVKVGSVRSVGLQGTHVLVKFRVKNAWLGDQSTAAIKIKTLLGQKYLAIDPQGSSRLKSGNAIPLTRTTSPYDVTQAFEGLGSTVGQIDTKQLAQSFETISDAFKNSPASVRSTLQGLTALSRTISSRDAQLTTLLSNTKQITQTLSDRDSQFQSLIKDGNLLLAELQQRRDAITDLLTGTRQLSVQLNGLVADNQKTLGPALTQLDTVTTVLQQNQDNLDNALRLAGPYYGLLDNALGNGRWLDVYICGLFDAQNNPVLKSNAQRNCAPKAPGGAK
ncbi:MAG: MCE family protein [Actinomycetota bacterium]|nr:MCE family protein [Actinomycetota bacterium]